MPRHNRERLGLGRRTERLAYQVATVAVVQELPIAAGREYAEPSFVHLANAGTGHDRDACCATAASPRLNDLAPVVFDQIAGVEHRCDARPVARRCCILPLRRELGTQRRMWRRHWQRPKPPAGGLPPPRQGIAGAFWIVARRGRRAAERQSGQRRAARGTTPNSCDGWSASVPTVKRPSNRRTTECHPTTSRWSSRVRISRTRP